MTQHSNPPLPRRLHALAQHLARTQDLFADWQLERKGPSTPLFPNEDADLVRMAGRTLVPIAGDGSGGVLVLDMSGGDAETAPVVSFDSEGGIVVLGRSFDDFLALLASDDPAVRDAQWQAEPPLKAWIRETGTVLHSSLTSHLATLDELTRRFWIHWTESLRFACAHLRPREVVEHTLVLGERMGEVVLGMSVDALSEKWGKPNIPSWAISDRGVHAFYAGAPFVVRLDQAQQCVTGVTLYKGRHRVTTPEGTAPMFMRASDAMKWLSSLGLSASCTRSEIAVPAVGLRLTLTSPVYRGGVEPWVEAVEMVER